MFLKKGLLFLILSTLSCFIALQAPKTVTAAGADFTITPIHSAAQSDTTLDYFSLIAQPQQRYTLTTQVANLSATETLDFEARLLTATTSSYGRINYIPTDQPKDKSLAHTLPELLVSDQSAIQKFSLAPNTKQAVTYQIQLPKTDLIGTLLGSIYVHRLPKAAQKTTTQIQNEFSMIIPIMIRAEKQTPLLPQLSLDKVSLQSAGGQPELVAVVHNASPVMFGKIKIEAAVYKKGTTKALLRQMVKDFEMAPNSTLRHKIATNQQPLPTGTYRLKLRLTSGAKVFHLNRTFTISNQTRQAVDEKKIQTATGPDWTKIWLIISLITSGCLLLLIGGLYLKR